MNTFLLCFRHKNHPNIVKSTKKAETLAELEFPKILEKAMQKPSHPVLRSKIKMKDEEIQPKMTSRTWKAKSPEIFKSSNKFANAKEAINTFQNQRKQTTTYIEATTDDLRNHYWRKKVGSKH